MQSVLITAYKNIQHLEEIIDFFDDNFNIYIHIDKKSVIPSGAIDELYKKGNVKYISRKYKINWGGLNHLLAILDITRQAFDNNENQYFHLITGHDYPIKPKEEFDIFYQKNKGLNFMEYHQLPYEPWPEQGMDRLSRYNMYDLIDGRSGKNEILLKRFSKLQKLLGIKRSFRKDFPQQHGGSTYWSLSRESIGYTFSYLKENPWFLKRFKYTFCAEEIFFQTILMNSPLKDKIINNNMRFIVWENRNGNFPANLDLTDYNNIQNTEALFARKFEYPTSGQLLSLIKKDLQQKTQ
ncbi:beta-1,6-N-acetylglucosaminyltransferase [Dysgonomonas macrotermitis]|uniref:Peptide O-xylosyltransferase n=1 Tax=Dysgonomonas macrotermitis TaxID=1346286 RepID=A0A1M5IAJ6_9BACT|nr:beta-1,6-N-acetylglucosaminyltransferase [Dysgonomonas macrotermitis]SHG25394.1 Core-2/I-Branching enzyme [Dysgonomonas macrotermitis]